MIERNLGNAERVVRLMFALLFVAWAVAQPAMNAVEWFVVAVATMLMLNGIFSRCYLWYVLDVRSNGDSNESAPTTIC